MVGSEFYGSIVDCEERETSLSWNTIVSENTP